MLRRRRIIVLLAITVCVVASLVYVVGVNDSSSPSPSVSLTNAVKSPYVEEAACTECHEEQAEDYQTSGHATTFFLTAQSDVAKWLDGRSIDDPERPYAYQYHFDKETGLSVSIPRQFGEDRFQLPYALGSGHNAVTFLALIPDRFGDTIGIEHRLSMFAAKDGWEADITPGQRTKIPRQDVEHFGAVMRGDTLSNCVGCHVTESEFVKQRIEGLQPHVGCQSCHGPGREHVTAIEEGTDDKFIGFTEQSAREEVEVCGNCHRLGHSDPEVELSPDNIHHVRFQSVGLLQSRCFTESGEQLSCTTCHDPHRTVSRNKQHYVDQCLKCHGEAESIQCAVSPRTNCIQCHMPPIDIHRGITFHDHWIRVRTDIPKRPLGQGGHE
jgi:Cytochrome c554 and c-prime